MKNTGPNLSNKGNNKAAYLNFIALCQVTSVHIRIYFLPNEGLCTTKAYMLWHVDSTGVQYAYTECTLSRTEALLCQTSEEAYQLLLKYKVAISTTYACC